MANAPEIKTWPGQDGKPVEHTAGTDAVLKVEVTPSEAKVSWAPKGKLAVGDAGEHFLLSDNDRTLTIKSITDGDKGEWTVKAEIEGKLNVIKSFEIKVNPKQASDGGDGEPPLEWDNKVALIAGIVLTFVAAVLVVLIGLWALAVKPEGRWQVTDVPVVLVFTLAWLATVALLASVYLGVLSVRARARAVTTATKAAKGATVADSVAEKAFEKAPEIINAYGSLKESAALGFVAMALVGGAIGLAIAKFPDVTAPTKTLTVSSTANTAKKTCTISIAVNGAAITSNIPASRYDLTLKHSSTANIDFKGGALSASVQAAGGKDLETSLDLSQGTYKATCTPTATGTTAGSKKFTVTSS